MQKTPPARCDSRPSIGRSNCGRTHRLLRLTAAWARNPDGNDTYQVIGNFLSYSGSETENEGAANVIGSDVNAYRSSAFKDWFASGPDTNGYVNDVYTVAAFGTSGWTLTSSNGKVSKTISLADNAEKLSAA